MTASRKSTHDKFFLMFSQKGPLKKIALQSKEDIDLNLNININELVDRRLMTKVFSMTKFLC